MATRHCVFDNFLVSVTLRAVLTMPLSRTWRDRLLGAGAGATLTVVALWLVLVSGAAAAVIRRA